MFYNLEEFLENLMLFRLVWIRGTMGGGKTLLSVALLDQFFKLGLIDGAICNFPTVLPASLGADDGLLVRRGLIYDEAWQQLDSRSSMVNNRTSVYGAYGRKLQTYWIFPSVLQIDKRLRAIVVWRQAVIRLPFLPEIWLYRWSLDLDYDKQIGWFLLVNPQRYFGMYDTAYIPTDDGNIERRYDNTIHKITAGVGVPTPAVVAEYLSDYAALDTLLPDLLGGGADGS
jgi:hypothetical protein